jgi:hypothetical protein
MEHGAFQGSFRSSGVAATSPHCDMDRASTLIVGRRERLTRILGRPLSAPPPSRTVITESSRKHLLEDAQDLYWNELAWEHLTSEEGLGDGALLEMAFPGFLAFVRALLLDEVMPDAKAPAEPRPEVAEDVLHFLGERIVQLEEELGADEVEERERLTGELGMTNRLLDVVLYRYHGLTPSDVERVEAAHVRH